MSLMQLILPETYLFGCGAKIMIDGNFKRSTLVCSFYPSLLTNRGDFAYKSVSECKTECNQCTQNSTATNCDTIKCIGCKFCSKKGTTKFSSLCGKLSYF